MTVKQIKNKPQLNNAGFTLLEVLIAVIILAVISVPILRAFVTTAQTNAKSKLKMRATNTAENLIEDFKSEDLETLVEEYSKSGLNHVYKPGETTDAGGNIFNGYVFDIGDNSYYKEKLPDNYAVKVTLDPSKYSHTNSINYGEFSTLSPKSSAIFSMEKDFDDKVYKLFEEKNNELAKADSTIEHWNKADFDKKLRREIKVTIESSGKFTDDLGDEVPYATVKVDVKYVLDDDKVVPDNMADGYVAMTRKVFTNKQSKIPLKNVYVMYNPRYASAAYNDGDIVSVINADNVPVNLYVVAQKGVGGSSDWKDYNKTGKCPVINVFENVSTPINDDTETATTLFTNLNEGAEYLKKDDSEQRMVTCYLNLARPSAYKELKRGKSTSKHTFGDKKYAKALDSRDVDGKLLDASKVDNKIYKITVEVREAGASLPMATMTGTKTN